MFTKTHYCGDIRRYYGKIKTGYFLKQSIFGGSRTSTYSLYRKSQYAIGVHYFCLFTKTGTDIFCELNRSECKKKYHEELLLIMILLATQTIPTVCHLLFWVNRVYVVLKLLKHHPILLRFDKSFFQYVSFLP